VPDVGILKRLSEIILHQTQTLSLSGRERRNHRPAIKRARQKAQPALLSNPLPFECCRRLASPVGRWSKSQRSHQPRGCRLV